jgi:hypothetical protein
MTPSIQSNGDAVAIYYHFGTTERFTEAAQTLFNIVAQAQRVHPNKSRVLYLDIDGHRNVQGGFDADALELQKEFVLGFLTKFFTEVTLPLTKGAKIRNPEVQQNEVPTTFIVRDT